MLGYRRILLALGMMLALLVVLSVGRECIRKKGAIRIGSKNFTEQVILAEIMAQLIEGRLGLPVERKLNLGGTFVCFNALRSGQLDIYVEYTGTALTTILKRPMIRDPDRVYRIVKRDFRARWKLEWLGRFGFSNAWTMTMRRQQAQRLGVRRISDLRAHRASLRAAFDHEFMERSDGYPGLARHYGFRFTKRPRELDPGLMYKAAVEGQVDVISGFATDGRIRAYDLVILEDDKRFFPPYDAAPVVRAGLLDKHPEIRKLLGELKGRLSTKRMRALNYQVDVKGRSPASVARQFIRLTGLAEPPSQRRPGSGQAGESAP
jgi:glycine betaine/choline ABC-type transport system substrate-binding protein